jgi:hypothetical protein
MMRKDSTQRKQNIMGSNNFSQISELKSTTQEEQHNSYLTCNNLRSNSHDTKKTQSVSIKELFLSFRLRSHASVTNAHTQHCRNADMVF